MDLNLTEGRPIAALMAEVSVCQAATYAGQGAEARDRLADLRLRTGLTGNPSARAWPHYVSGEALAEVDVPGALAAYRVAMEESAKVDNRLFLGLARSSAVALVARHGSAHESLAELERVMDEWDALGNVTAQWWVLMNLVDALRPPRPGPAGGAAGRRRPRHRGPHLHAARRREPAARRRPGS